MRLTRTLLALTVATLLAGCAITTVTPVARDDTKTKGFRYYEAKPLLIVTQDSAQIVFVPNLDRAYAIQYRAFMTKHEISLTMTEGWWYKEIHEKSDPAEFIKGLIALGREALETATAAGAKAASDPVSGKLVGIYEFRFDGQGNIQTMHQLYP